MIDGDSPQLGLLIQTFNGYLPGDKSVVLFEHADGTIGIPTIEYAATLDYTVVDGPLLQLQQKYGIAIENKGAIKFLFNIGENHELDIFDFRGIFGRMLPGYVRKPIFFPISNIEEILEEKRLSIQTQKTLIFLLTKLALKGRLC